MFCLGGLRFLKSVVGLDEFPSLLALASRIQPFSQLLGLSYVIGVHRAVVPTALRLTGTGPCEGRAAGPKLVPPLTSLWLSSIREVPFCVCSGIIHLRKHKSPRGWWAFCPNVCL